MEVVIKSNSTFDWTQQLETDAVDIHYHGDDFSVIKPYYSNVLRLYVFQPKALDRVKSLEEIQILKIKGTLTAEIVNLVQTSLCLTKVSWEMSYNSTFEDLKTEVKTLKEFYIQMDFNKKRNIRLFELSDVSE